MATKLSTRQGPKAEPPERADAAGNAVFVLAGIGLLAARLAGSPHTLLYDAKVSLVDAHFGVLNPAALESRLEA